ncbi:MAG: SIMPL domain-containing protein [Verrucomicrobiales bacterium]|nr:SIMPL domain-containing protein [Verrucomicrobiales bacterium]
MKKLTTVFVLLLGMCVSAFAEDFKIPHVSVFGTAEIRVVPDEMIWSLSISTKDKEFGSVIEAHDQKVGKVLKFLRNQEIAEKDIASSHTRLTEHSVPGVRAVPGDIVHIKKRYNASSTIIFKFRDLKKYSSVWLGIAKLSDTRVFKMSYDTSQRIKHQNDARVEAIKVAKKKAIALAKAAGISLGGPILIEEQQQGAATDTVTLKSFPVYGSIYIAPGTIAVKTSVQMKFRISAP